MSYFSLHFYKGWDFDFLLVHCCLNTKKGDWFLIDVQEAFDHEVLAFIYEALTVLLKGDLSHGISLRLLQVDVLSS